MGKDTKQNIERTVRLMLQQDIDLRQGAYGEAVGKYLIACADLRDALEVCYRENVSGNLPLLRAEDVSALRERYLAIIRTAQAAKDASDTDGLAEHPAVRSQLALMEELDRAVGPELAALSATLPRENITLPELIDQARGYEVDISGTELSKTGGSLSNRIPVTFTDRDGVERRGFFTETVSSNLEADCAEVVARTSKGNSKYRRFFTQLAGDPMYRMTAAMPSSVDNVERSILETGSIAEAIADQLKEFAPEDDPDGYRQKVARLTQERDFNLQYMEFFREMKAVSNRYQVFNACAISKNDRIEERNVAMSAVADLLGVGNLVARSVKMNLVKDGKKMSGVFMEFAPGSDIGSLKENDPLYSAKKADLDTPQARRSLSDLQVLDYLCANTDRHVGNMFFQFDRQGKMTGVIGIDNDCSFGALDTGDVMQMVKLEKLNAISRSMADRICALTPDMLDVMLCNITLSPEERASARTRLADLQDAIARGREHYRGRDDAALDPGCLRILEDNEWERYSFAELGKGIGKSYYQSVASLAETSKGNAAQRQQDQAQIEALKNIDPALVPEKAAVQNARGVRFRAIDAGGLASEQRKLRELGEELKKVNSGAFISSPEFDDVILAFKNVQSVTSKLRGNSLNWGLHNANAAYLLLEKKLDIYTKKKEQEAQTLAAKGKQPSDRAKTRVAFAEKLRAFSEAQRFGLDDELRSRAYASGSVDAILAEGTLPECRRVRQAIAAYRAGSPDALAQVIAEGVGGDRIARNLRPDAPNRFREAELYGGLMEMAQADPALKTAVAERLPSMPDAVRQLQRAAELRSLARWSDDSLEKLRSGQKLPEHEKTACVKNLLAQGLAEASLAKSSDLVTKPNALRSALAADLKRLDEKSVTRLAKKSAAELCRMLGTAEGRIASANTLLQPPAQKAPNAPGRSV